MRESEDMNCELDPGGRAHAAPELAKLQISIVGKMNMENCERLRGLGYEAVRAEVYRGFPDPRR